MGVVKKALVRTVDGYVKNVVLYDEDGNWVVPVGYELVDAEYPARIGATWDGTRFIAPVIVTPRLDVLMAEGPATQVTITLDGGLTYRQADRPAEDIAADKAELLALLKTKLAASGDLTWEQMNKMLALERES